MTHSLTLFEQALQAPTMEAVIALSERVQTLEAKPEGVVYTAYRGIDHTLLVGYTETLAATTAEHQQGAFDGSPAAPAGRSVCCCSPSRRSAFRAATARLLRCRHRHADPSPAAGPWVGHSLRVSKTTRKRFQRG